MNSRKDIALKIKQLNDLSFKLRLLAFDLPIEESEKLREKQNKIYKQLLFYKELAKTMDNQIGEKNGNLVL